MAAVDWLDNSNIISYEISKTENNNINIFTIFFFLFKSECITFDRYEQISSKQREIGYDWKTFIINLYLFAQKIQYHGISNLILSIVYFYVI